MTRTSLRYALVLALAAGALALGGCTAPAPSEEPPPPSEQAPEEPEAACPDHTAGAHDGSMADPYRLGDAISLGCFTVVVTAVNTDATEEVMAANPDAAPSSGNVFMTVTMSITRESDGPGDPTEIDVLLAGSMTTDGKPADVAVTPPPPSGELAEGATVVGTYVFEMSAGAATSVELAVGTMQPVNVQPY